MTLFQDAQTSPSPGAAALAELLALFGAVADFAIGLPRGHSRRIARLTQSLAQVAELEPEERDAAAFASLLHGIGALGNPAYRKHEPLAERAAEMSRWDVPADGARICEKLTMLPPQTADYVRWQTECWDGSGSPDQLRWSGIPRAAQLMHIAHSYLQAGEAEEGLAKIVGQGGTSFSPELTRAFIMWFHTFSGEIDELPLPVQSLRVSEDAEAVLLDLIADRIDLHNGAVGRWQRVADRAARTAIELGLDSAMQQTLATSARLFGIGELRAEMLESQKFDALARLGRDERGRNAVAAAAVLEGFSELQPVAAVLKARAEWFDGTGLPLGLRREQIPLEARVLAPCIAYDAIVQAAHAQVRSERTVPLDRVEDGSGTQFDPAVVRAHTQLGAA